MRETPNAPHIRPVRESEHELLGEITVRAYREGGFLTGENDYYAAHLRDVSGRAASAEVLAALDGDQVLGGVTLALPGSPLAEIGGAGEAEIRMLAVDPSGHGRGAGTALVRACIDRARGVGGVKRVVLCSQTSMLAAHRVYEALGFERSPELDWEPVPGIRLWGYSLEL